MSRPNLVELVCSWCGLRAMCVAGHDGGRRVAICSACAHTAAEVHAQHTTRNADTSPPPRRAPDPRLARLVAGDVVRYRGATGGAFRGVVTKVGAIASIVERDGAAFLVTSRGVVTLRTATANARSVWTIPTEPYDGPHHAAFPRELARRCIVAGSRPGDLVLDPFAGTGTTLEVALRHGRRAVGVELSPTYVELIEARLSGLQLPLDLAVGSAPAVQRRARRALGRAIVEADRG